MQPPCFSNMAHGVNTLIPKLFRIGQGSDAYTVQHD